MPKHCRLQYLGRVPLLLLLAAPAAAAPGATIEVSIIGRPTDGPARDDAASVRVIELGPPGARSPGRAATLAEALRGEPGVTLRGAGGLGQFSGASLRGSESNQVALYLDGVPLQQGGLGTVDLSSLPLDGIERVEIYRGVPPLSLGPDAIGGAINLISRPAGAGPGAWASASSGSFGLRKVAAGLSRSSPDGIRATATASYQGASGDFPYYDTDGLRLTKGQDLLRQNDDFDQAAADVRVDLLRGPLTLRLYGHGQLKRQGVPGRAQVGTAEGRPALTTARAVLGAVAARRLGPHATLQAELFGLVETSLFNSWTVPRPPPPDAVHTEALSGQTGATLKALLSGPAGFEHTLLVDGRFEALRGADLCPAPQRCADPRLTLSTRGRLGLGLGSDQHLLGDRLLLSPGLYFLYAASALHAPVGSALGDAVTARQDAFLSPRLGVRVRLSSGFIARLSGGRFVRLPTFLELFGDRAFFRPSPDLVPESAWVAEAGLRGERALWGGRLWLSVEVNGAARLVDDLILTLRDGPLLRAQNVGQARMLSAETSLEGALFRVARLALHYSFLDGRDGTRLPGRAGTLLPGRPMHSVLLRVELRGPGLWRASYELDHASMLYLGPGENAPRPARTLHAVGVQLGPAPVLGAAVTLGVEVRNLLDTRVVELPLSLSSAGGSYRFPLSDFVDFPLPGRAVYATLSARL